MAAVFCACFSRSAMRLRSRVIRTRSSRGARRAARAARRARRRGAGAAGAAAAARSRQGCGVGPGRRLALRAPDVEHVALGQAAVLAGGRDARCGSSLFSVDQLAHGRRQPVGAGAAVGGRSPGAGCGAVGRRWRGGRRGARALRGRRGRRRRRRLGDHAEHRADLDGGAVAARGSRPACRRSAHGPPASPCRSRARPAARRRDRLADRLQPFRDGRLGHRFAERGNDDIAWSWQLVRPPCRGRFR